MAQRTLTVKILGDDASLHRAFTRSSRGAKGFERDIGHASRGALAGSGIFRGLGRSIAFASGGFLAFASAGQFLRTSIDAAKEAAVTQAQLAAQFRASGRDLGVYQKEIDRTTNRLSALSGFQNDELKAGFVTIFRTTGSVSKGLRDLATAADLARAKHISLAQASLIIAKVEGGNTKLLQRQLGIRVKSGHVEEALALLRARVAGQARAGTTEQERFGAVLHNTEEIIGTGLLPTINKYLASGSKWLEQMNESGDLQRKVASAADAFSGAVQGVVSAVKIADRLTGSFKRTIELLIALKTARWALSVARDFGIIGGSAEKANFKVAALRTSLKKLGLIGAIVIGIDLVVNAKGINEKLRDKIPFLAKIQDFEDKHNPVAHFLNNLAPDVGVNPQGDTAAASIRISAAKVAKETTDFGVRVARAITKAKETIAAASKFTAQGNTFFDNALARILLRGGLGTIQQQIAALQRANVLIAARLKATKDVTRRLNLEDEILQNAAQIKSLQAQQSADALQKAADALQKRKDAFGEFIAGLELNVTKAQTTSTFKDNISSLQALEAGIKLEIKEFGRTAELAGELFDAQQRLKDARQSQISAKEFFTLGLGPTGEERIPLKSTLKKRFGTIHDLVKGTSLDTPALEAKFKNVGKVLAEKIVPPDVRAKIDQWFDEIDQKLKGRARNLTKFHHVNSDAILSGLGLDPNTQRIIRARLSTIGANGSVPGRSAAFSGAGATTGDVYLDGRKVGTVVRKHNRKADTRRSDSRRGPYAGRN